MAAMASPAETDHTPLRQLQAGNRRFMTGHSKHPHQTLKRMHQVASEQHPLAAVLSCADSRVPPEIVFDEGLGDLFTVRVAGNIVDDAVIGSLEYAVEHLHTRLIVVMGHTHCGAVKAAIADKPEHTHIDRLVEAIRPAVSAARRRSGNLEANAVRANVEQAVRGLKASGPVLAPRVRDGRLKIVGAIYDLDRGKVRFLP
jgi:carbonic anhydrase